MPTHIAVLMMVKNETKRLRVSLDSVRGFADSLVVFDTGSTDDTIAILETFAAESGIPLRLKQGEFVDFSTSRNVSLDFADEFPEIEYLLLLDCNGVRPSGLPHRHRTICSQRRSGFARQIDP